MINHPIDKQIAAISLIHDLTVITRNANDFRGAGVVLNNPFAGHACRESHLVNGGFRQCESLRMDTTLTNRQQAVARFRRLNQSGLFFSSACRSAKGLCVATA